MIDIAIGKYFIKRISLLRQFGMKICLFLIHLGLTVE